MKDIVLQFPEQVPHVEEKKLADGLTVGPNHFNRDDQNQLVLLPICMYIYIYKLKQIVVKHSSAKYVGRWQ